MSYVTLKEDIVCLDALSSTFCRPVTQSYNTRKLWKVQHIKLSNTRGYVSTTKCRTKSQHEKSQHIFSKCAKIKYLKPTPTNYILSSF